MKKDFNTATEQIKKYSDAISLLTNAIGVHNVKLLKNEMGEKDFDFFIQDISVAQSIYPMYRKIEFITNDDELKKIYEYAAEQQSKIKKESLHTDILTGLSQKIYDICDKKIRSSKELQRIYSNWSKATFKEKAILFEEINAILSQSFNLPPPKLLFFLNGLKIYGMSLPNSILLNLGSFKSIDLICHEFTHYLQRHNLTAAKECINLANKYYITPTLIPGQNRGKFNNFILNKIYKNSIIEAEASFIEDYIKAKEKQKILVLKLQKEH